MFILRSEVKNAFWDTEDILPAILQMTTKQKKKKVWARPKITFMTKIWSVSIEMHCGHCRLHVWLLCHICPMKDIILPSNHLAVYHFSAGALTLATCPTFLLTDYFYSVLLQHLPLPLLLTSNNCWVIPKNMVTRPALGLQVRPISSHEVAPLCELLLNMCAKHISWNGSFIWLR